jgi:signal transduction histidine kinase
MTWTTHSMLDMEREQNRMAGDATVQEMARLALWRMESSAVALVREESSRPAEQYRPFAVPEGMVDNKTNSTVNPGDLLSLSSVLRAPPEDVLLHFEMDASGAIRSPQVPQGRDLAMCQMVGVLPEPAVAENKLQLAKLTGILDKGVTTDKKKSLLATLKVPPRLTGNRAWVWGNNEQIINSPLPSPPPEPPVQSRQGKLDNRSEQQIQSPINGYAQQAVNWKPEQAQAQQSEFNADEAQARAGIVKSGTEKAASRRISSANTIEENSKKVYSKPADKALLKETVPAPAPAAAAPASGTSATPAMSDFHPFWLGGALILTRRVSTGDREWIQGAWLDWDKLRSEFVSVVQDRFPEAQIVPAPENAPPGAHLLASLPVQLIPGAVTFAPLAFWTPLKVSLGIAWLCVLLAVAAVALVLRGMMALSERRASFVSSVTHELRTPLATFKLYSEMLADGMVKEESKKQQYLETLTGEADRLGHLVENVLSYSRIERGKGPAAACAVPVSDLLHRIEPRLNQRALMAGMDFAVSVAPDVTALALRTDAGAVEQILCNLVDNACKYGRRDGVPGSVELVVSRDRRRVCFAVRDHGPGIDRNEEKKLFLPFHKSAREAAHSKPGVGLGLALCRRLAVELRGTLEIDRTWRQGASFILKLPA